MEHKKLKLPVGIQRFEKIRKDGCLYVDKTKYVVEMIRKGNRKNYAKAYPDALWVGLVIDDEKREITEYKTNIK